MAKSKKARGLDELAAQIRVCTHCSLHESRTHAVPGGGSYNARVMIIGEASGRKEDESGHTFVGSAGRYLNRLLRLREPVDGKDTIEVKSKKAKGKSEDEGGADKSRGAGVKKFDAAVQVRRNVDGGVGRN